MKEKRTGTSLREEGAILSESGAVADRRTLLEEVEECDILVRSERALARIRSSCRCLSLRSSEEAWVRSDLTRLSNACRSIAFISSEGRSRGCSLDTERTSEFM